MNSINHELIIVLEHIISDVLQTMVFGAFFFSFPVFVYILVRKGKKTRAKKFMLGLVSVMFASCTFFWIYMVLNDVGDLLRYAGVDSFSVVGRGIQRATLRAWILINLAITDAVVIWRAWALCREYRAMLHLCNMFLFLTAATSVMCIVVRMLDEVVRYGNDTRLEKFMSIFQIANLSMSLMGNMLATSIISHKTWKSWKEFKISGKKLTRTGHIFLLVIESGMVYCISGLFALVGSFVRIPAQGISLPTLGDIYIPVHAQLSGLYPTIVIILVSERMTLEESIPTTIAQPAGDDAIGRCGRFGTTHYESMQFRNTAAGSVIGGSTTVQSI